MRILFLLVLFLLFACNDTTHYDRELALYGKAVDSDGEPLANAEVYVFPYLNPEFSGMKEQTQNILEVELVSFDAIDKIDYVLLEWQTASEINNKIFVIEKSINNSPDFIAIDSIEGAGNSSATKSYSTKDYDISPKDFYMYRLKIINEAEEFAYSGIISLQPFNPVVQLSTPYPNPFSSHVILNFAVLDYDNQYIEIVEQSTGEVVKTFNNFNDFSHHSISFSGYDNGDDIRPGVYICNLHYGDSLKSVKFVKHLDFQNYWGDLSEFVTKTDENGLFKITYNYFPDLDSYPLTIENGQMTGNFMYGGGAEIVVRKLIYEDGNAQKILISKDSVEIDKTRILEITCFSEKISIQ